MKADDLHPDRQAPASPLSIFISNAPAEDALSAQLASALNMRGWQAWRHGPRSKSAAYRATTLEAIEQAQIVIVLWSETSRVSPWEIDEADVGMKKGAAIGVELPGAVSPLGFAGAARVSIQSVADGLSQPDQMEILEAVLDVADAIGLLGGRHVWLDRSAQASVSNLLTSIAVFGLLPLTATVAQWPAFLLGTTGLVLSVSFVVGSVGGGYAGDWLAQRLSVAPRAYRRRLLFRWAGEGAGAGVGGLIGFLAVTGARGHSLSSEWLDGVQIMLGGMSLVAWVLLAIKFVPLVISKRLHRRLLGRPH